MKVKGFTCCTPGAQLQTRLGCGRSFTTSENGVPSGHKAGSIQNFENQLTEETIEDSITTMQNTGKTAVLENKGEGQY